MGFGEREELGCLFGVASKWTVILVENGAVEFECDAVNCFFVVTNDYKYAVDRLVDIILD